MSKHLFLCRHAQTLEAEKGQRDLDLALTATGLQEANQAGLFIKFFGLPINAFYCSAALRTRQTAHEIALMLDFDITQLKSSQELYHVQTQTLLQQISHFNNLWQAVVLVGHNPVISEIVSRLSNDKIYVPTGGCNYFKSAAPDWQLFDSAALQLKTNF